MKILHKIATVLVALLLYGIIVILQMPKTARAAEGFVTVGASRTVVAAGQPAPDYRAHCASRVLNA